MKIIKIFTAPTEIDASIIKGALENGGIKASVGPGINSLSPKGWDRGPNVPHDVFVEEDRVEEALKIIKENGELSAYKIEV